MEGRIEEKKKEMREAKKKDRRIKRKKKYNMYFLLTSRLLKSKTFFNFTCCYKQE